MSQLFAYGHATHPQWGMAAALVLAQLRASLARPDHAPLAHCRMVDGGVLEKLAALRLGSHTGLSVRHNAPLASGSVTV